MLVQRVILGNLKTLKKWNLERLKDRLQHLSPRLGMEEESPTYTFTNEVTGHLRRELIDNLNCLNCCSDMKG